MYINRITDVDILSYSDKDYLSFISKKNKIHEEIKDYVIDRFIKKISIQHKEIIELKQKLEKVISNSLIILKKCLLKSNFFSEKEIKLSYYFNNISLKQKKNNENFKADKRNISKLGQIDNIKKSKVNINSLISLKKNSHINFNPKLFLNHRNKAKNKLLKYNKPLNNYQTYKSFSRNYFKKNSTFYSDRQSDTYFIENKNKIEPISTYNTQRTINNDSNVIKDGIDKLILNEKIKYKISSFIENKLEGGQNKNSKTENIIAKNKFKLSSTNRNKTKNINSFKKLNLSNIVINNRHNLNNNILDYFNTERTITKRKKILEKNLIKRITGYN